MGPLPAAEPPPVVAQVVVPVPDLPEWSARLSPLPTRPPALDEPGFPALVLAMLALFVVITGRGDRRDPKLVRAELDADSHEVGFS